MAQPATFSIREVWAGFCFGDKRKEVRSDEKAYSVVVHGGHDGVGTVVR